MPYSDIVNPVALPAGRARLATKPAPTGSMTVMNTIGTVRVACSNGAAVAVPVAPTRTSGERREAGLSFGCGPIREHAEHQCRQFHRVPAKLVGVGRGATVDLQVAAVAPAQLRQGLCLAQLCVR